MYLVLNSEITCLQNSINSQTPAAGEIFHLNLAMITKVFSRFNDYKHPD